MREGGTDECPYENIVAAQCIPDMREGGTDECPYENAGGGQPMLPPIPRYYFKLNSCRLSNLIVIYIKS